MAEKIKGFSIELGLDSLKVDSGLKNVRRSISQMNGEMRANMSQFDRSERSMEKYSVQLEGLNKKLELQKQITKQAKDDYQKMVDTHGEGSREAHNAAVAYNREAAELNNLERYVGRVSKEMEEFARQQQIQQSGWFKTGDALENFGNKLGGISSVARDVGGSLTRHITLPAMGVITAAGGITAAFGWKRLVGLDSAKAQLRGLGYEAEDVERITDGLVDALDGGMMTMAEATSAAATAMASGVKEGDELTRYIQTLDSAVVGSTGTFQEMEQIFGRITDQGKLTRNEFDMISNRMPGFSSAVQKHMDVGSEAMYEMLRNGEITSSDFIDIMEKHAGGMAKAYAESWQGMVQNTKAYTGIIGENLLSGVFEQSKDSLREFEDLLRSESVQNWAKEMGEKIGGMFTRIVKSIKTGVEWFKNLSDSQQKMIVKFGALAIAAGPLITGLGILGGAIAKVSSGLGVFFKWLAPIMTPLKGIGKAAGGAGKSVGLLGRIFAGLTNPVGIAITIITLLSTAFTVAYKKSETFRNFVQKLGEKIKDIFGKVVNWVKPGFEAVTGFFGEIKEKITAFRDEEGPGLIEAFQNIWDFVGPILEWIAEKVTWAFETVIKPIIGFVMKAVELVIKMVWENIKGVITGALDVIMGAIKIFSGIFTGDTEKMWEGIKQLFFGAIKIIWNWIQLQFIGRILKGVGGLAKGFWEHIKNLWKWVKETFTNSISSVYNGFKNSFVGRIITNVINFAKNFRTNISNMWTAIKNTFSKWITNIRNSIADSFVGRMISSVRSLKTNFVRIAKEMWQGVKEQFGNIVDGAKALPGRIGRGISNAKDKAISGMKTVGNSLITWAGTPFNRVIGGVNWVTGKLGIKKKIPYWNYPQYAKGTKGRGHPGGIAMIGEEGRELVKLPTGESFVSPSTHTMLDLPKGTQVIPNKQTEEILKFDIPHYAKGTSGWQSAIGDVWDYITNPSKVISKIWDNIAIKTGMAEVPRNIVTGGMSFIKDKAVSFIKSKYKDAESLGGGKPAFGWPVTSPFGYRVHPISGARKLHGGVDFGAPSGTPVPSQTGGIVSFAGGGWNGGFGNLVRVKQGIWEMFYAHLSRILVRAGQSVTKGQILGNVGSTGASTGPHLHYETRKNGVRVNPMSLKGFATGGLVKSKMLAMLGEEGEEVVIPTAPNRRTDAMKLLALAAKKIGADNGSFVRPNGVSIGGGDDDFKELLKEVVEQNEHLQKMVDLLMQLLDKDIEAVLAFEPIYNAIKKRMNEDKYSRHKQRRGR